MKRCFVKGFQVWACLFPFFWPSVLYSQDLPENPEIERFFGDELRARVIQARVYEKARHYSLSATLGVIPNDDLFIPFPFSARFDYFFTETLGVGLRGSYVVRAKSRLFKKFPTLNDLGRVMARYEELVYDASVQLEWVPIYGKFALLGTGITHIEAGLQAGIGALGVKRHRVRNVGTTSVYEEVSSGVKVFGNAGLVLHLYLSRIFALRFEYLQFFYKSSGDNVFLPAELSIGLTWFIVPLGVGM